MTPGLFLYGITMLCVHRQGAEPCITQVQRQYPGSAPREGPSPQDAGQTLMRPDSPRWWSLTQMQTDFTGALKSHGDARGPLGVGSKWNIVRPGSLHF